MLKLTETYQEIILEGANEDQARAILNKTDMEESDIDEYINMAKSVDPTNKNKYLPLIARLKELKEEDLIGSASEKGIADNIGGRLEEFIEEVMLIEKHYGATPQYKRGKKEGKGNFFFNRDIDDFDIEGGDPYPPMRFIKMMRDVGDKLRQYHRLQQARGRKKDDNENDDAIFKVDGQETDKLAYQSEDLEIYVGHGQQACIHHSKGTDWCIGKPETGHYAHRRKRRGSTFYFVYDDNFDSLTPAHRVVVEVRDHNGDGERDDIKVHDMRNEEDDYVDMGKDRPPHTSKDYLSYLKREHGVDVDEIFRIIPLSTKEKILNTLEEDDLEDIVGHTVEMEDGTVIDLTLQYVKRFQFGMYEYQIISEHPITKKFLDDYIWHAMINDTIKKHDIELMGRIPKNLMNRYIIREYNYHNKDAKAAYDNLPSHYLFFADKKVVNDLINQMIDPEDPRTAISFPRKLGAIGKLSKEIIKRSFDIIINELKIDAFNKELVIDSFVMLANPELDEEFVVEIFDKLTKKLFNHIGVNMYNLVTDKILSSLFIRYASDERTDKLLTRLYKRAKKNDHFVERFVYNTSGIRQIVGEEEHSEYVQNMIDAARDEVNVDVLYNQGIRDVTIHKDYIQGIATDPINPLRGFGDELSAKMYAQEVDKYGYLPEGMTWKDAYQWITDVVDLKKDEE